jgi:hypothetical protein
MPTIRQAQDTGELWSFIRTLSREPAMLAGKNTGDVEEDDSISACEDCSHKMAEETIALS